MPIIHTVHVSIQEYALFLPVPLAIPAALILPQQSYVSHPLLDTFGGSDYSGNGEIDISRSLTTADRSLGIMLPRHSNTLEHTPPLHLKATLSVSPSHRVVCGGQTYCNRSHVLPSPHPPRHDSDPYQQHANLHSFTTFIYHPLHAPLTRTVLRIERTAL